MEDGRRQKGKLRETDGQWETDRNSMGDGQLVNGRRTKTEWKAEGDRRAMGDGQKQMAKKRRKNKLRRTEVEK